MITLLIDGYNLLNACGVEATPGPPQTSELERARRGLLDFLAETLTAEEVAETLIVFDVHGPRWRGSVEERYRGLTVRFAVQYPDADTLLEQLIAQHTAPKQLTVVSSDHRVQRAARRRRAKFVDSEDWYAKLCRRLRNAPQSAREALRDTDDRLDRADVEDWLRKFGFSPKEAETPVVTEGDAAADLGQSESSPCRHSSKKTGGPRRVARRPGDESSDNSIRQGAANESSPTDDESLVEEIGEVGPMLPGEDFPDFGLSEDDLQKPIDAWDEGEERLCEEKRKPRKNRRPPRR